MKKLKQTFAKIQTLLKTYHLGFEKMLFILDKIQTGSEAAPSDERQTKNSLIFFKKILENSVMTWTFVEYFGIFYIL